MTEKKKTAGFALILVLVTSSVAGLLLVDLVTANPMGYVPTYLPKININGDGTITPETGYITRNGNTYTLTTDIINEYSINILCSNIIFDGQGHTISITTADNSNYLNGVKNVTLKNLDIHTRYIAISLGNSSNCTLVGIKSDKHIEILSNNTVTQCIISIGIYGSGNLITNNNITGIYVFDGSSNQFWGNNMLTDTPSFETRNFWDNGSVGNYWLDYGLKYPNGSEIGYSGIGNTPYIVNANNIDYHPLIYPINIENGSIALPIREPANEAFPNASVVGVSALVIAIIALGLFYYQKKKQSRKKENRKS